LQYIYIYSISFSYSQAPYEDPRACTGLIGVKLNGTKAHVLRAICEGIAFRFV